jgi:tetratricopeptide (TPR) repeat protein
VKDRAGQTVVSRLDEDTLKQIAETTQGFYLPAHQGALEAERLAQAIEHMQKRSLSGGRYGASEDRYQYLLLPALFSFWLPERKKSWLLLLALMLLSGHGWAGTADDVNLGNHAYGKGKFDQALQDYRDAQIKSPNNPVVTYDLGNALHQTGQFKEAEQAYQKVLKVRDAGLRAKTLYNLGNNFVQQGQYEDAVKKYHEALKLKPRDEDTIYNLSQALALMKNPPQKQKDQKNKQDQKNQKGQDKQQQQAQAGQQDSKENKGKDQKGQSGGGKPPSGPDDKGEQKAGQQAGQDTPSAQQHQPKPGEMRKEDAENVLDAVREAERAAWQDRLKQNQNQNPKSGQEDW